MKITIDTDEKTISVVGDIKISDLTDFFKQHNLAADEYRLIRHTVTEKEVIIKEVSDPFKPWRKKLPWDDQVILKKSDWRFGDVTCGNFD